jgi:hypothetical protein
MAELQQVFRTGFKRRYGQKKLQKLALGSSSSSLIQIVAAQVDDQFSGRVLPDSSLVLAQVDQFERG